MMQSISRKWDESRLFKALAAVALNALVLFFILLIVNVGYESNDDITMAAFVDGQMSHPNAHIPFIHYILGVLIKALYDVFGRGLPWYTITQCALLFVSFSAVSFVLFERLRFWQGALVSIVLLIFFGVDVYTIISFTKTSGVCTVAGMLLISHAMAEMEKGRRALPVILGVLLCIFGFMYRPMEFLPCFALMAVLSLRWLWALLFEEKAPAGEKLRRLVGYALPFVLVLLLCGGLSVTNDAAWGDERWRFYHETNPIRAKYFDYGRPGYDEMPETYDALGLSETSAALLSGGNHFDTEAFAPPVLQALSQARDEAFPPPSLGECLGKFLDVCLMGFFRNLHVYGFLIILALWLCAAEHKLKDWLLVAGLAGGFFVMYIYLIYQGRYLVDRVDVALFMALALSLAYVIRPEKLQQEKLLAGALLLVALYASYYLSRDAYRSNGSYVDREQRAIAETLIADEEHIYLAKLDTLSDRIYSSAFETPLPGYYDRIVFLGGWLMNHPSVMDNLASYGVSNPYRDCVGNERVYLIEDDIELTLAFIHEHYDEDATAQLVEPLSSDTGLMIYRILG